MAEELPDGTMGAYEGYCPKCKQVIKTNSQGNEIGIHVCGPIKYRSISQETINVLVASLETVRDNGYDNHRTLAEHALKIYHADLSVIPISLPGNSGEGDAVARIAKDFQKFIDELCQVIKEDKITLYRYDDRLDGPGNYILDDIWTVYKEKYLNESVTPPKEDTDKEQMQEAINRSTKIMDEQEKEIDRLRALIYTENDGGHDPTCG